jgi:hypothetical protein
MDRGTKIALGTAVLCAGILAALVFRRDATDGPKPMPEPRNQLVLRQTTESEGRQPRGTDIGRPSSDGPGASTKQPTPRKPVTILTPIDQGAPRPALATTFPGGTSRPVATPGADSRWGTSMSVGLPTRRRAGSRLPTHTVVDGDSLESLAAQYLGSDRRWPEIYRANRELLSSPDVLPIGVTLSIPLTGEAPEDPLGPGVHRPLAPVRPPASPFTTGAGAR